MKDCKELTKIHENTLSGSATDLISHFDTNKEKHTITAIFVKKNFFSKFLLSELGSDFF